MAPSPFSRPSAHSVPSPSAHLPRRGRSLAPRARLSALLLLAGGSMTAQEVDYAELGREFQQEHCPTDLGDVTCSVEHVLDAGYAHVRLGAYEVHYPTAFLDEGERREDLRDVALGLLDLQRVWLDWTTGGAEPFPLAAADLATLRAWVEDWKPKTLASLARDADVPRDLAEVYEASDEVTTAQQRLFALFHDQEALGLAIRDQGIGETPEPQAVRIVLAPTRRDFVGWLGFAGLVEPERQGEYWAPGTHEWTQIWSGWNLILALEYAPWSGFDPDFRSAKSMKSFEDTGLLEHVLLESGMALLRYSLERPVDHLDNALVLNAVVDVVGQVNVMDAEGQISRSGAQTQPYSRFVPGGNPNGGLLPPMSAAPYDSLVKNHWRESNGADHFLEALHEGQADGHKRAKRDKVESKDDPLANFQLQAAAQKHVVHAPFFGPHAGEQQYPPAEFLVDYREFFRAYKAAFVHWLRTHGVEADEAASAAAFARFVQGLDELDFETRGIEELVEEIYGVPLSGADGKTDSLEWRFLAFVEEWRG